MPNGYSGLPAYYVESSDPITPNLGLSLIGMDPIVAEDMVLIDTAFGTVSGSIKVNGSVVNSPNFINSASVTFSVVGSNISLTAAGGGGTPGLPLGSIQGNKAGTFGGVPGTVLDFVNGTVTIAPTGSGALSAALSVMGDSIDNDILDLYINGSHSPAAFFDSNGNFTAPVVTTQDINIIAEAFITGTLVMGTNANKTTLQDYSGSVGTAGQLLSSTHVGVLWINALTGTVTTFSAGALSPLFTTTVATASTTPALSFSLSNAAQNSVFAGPSTGGTGAPSYRALVAADIPALAYIATGLMTTLGDIIYENATPAPARLAGNTTTTKEYLSQTGNGTISAAPAWAQINYADITGTTPTPPSGAVLWSAIGNAGANLTLANAAFTTTFNQTSNVAWIWANTTTGTALTTNASPLLELSAQYYTGAATGTDLWTMSSALAAGTNAVSTLSIVHSGSTGTPTIVLGSNTNGSSLNLSTGGSAFLIFNSNSSTTLSASNQTAGGVLVLRGENQGNLTGAGGVQLTTGGTYAGASGTSTHVQELTTWNPSSGANAFCALEVKPTVNQTSTASGAYTGLRVNVVETAILGVGNKLLDLQAGTTGGTSMYSVDNKGHIGCTADHAGQVTVTAGNTTQAVAFTANYLGTGQPIIVLTPTSDPLAVGVPVGYWVTYSGSAGAWTGFTVNIQTTLAGNVTFNYIVFQNR